MDEHTETTLLSANDLKYSYLPGIRPVLFNTEIKIYCGELHLLLGQNGAGKSTLAKLLAGQMRCKTGSILRRSLGLDKINVSYLPQRLAIPPNCSLGEYLWLFYSTQNPSLPWLITGEQRNKLLISRLRPALEESFNPELPELLNEQLAMVSSHLLHLYIAALQLSRDDVNLHILDEPTAVLSESEGERLYSLMQNSLVRRTNKAILLITHRILETAAYAHRHTVMREGTAVFHGGKLDATTIQQAQEHMFGSEVSGKQPTTNLSKKKFKPETTKVLLDLQNIRTRFRDICPLSGISLDLKSGEIHAVSGIQNEGLEQLERLLSGRIREFQGRIIVMGEIISSPNMSTMRKRNIRFVPGEQARFGAALSLKNYENLGALHRSAFASGAKGFRREVSKIFGNSDFNDERPSSELSGGMLQKLIVNRELNSKFNGDNTLDPAICILANPGWGLDVTQKDKLYARVIEMRNRGWGLLLITTELSEALRIGDRISFLHGGKLFAAPNSAYGDYRKMEKYFLGQFPQQHEGQ